MAANHLAAPPPPPMAAPAAPGAPPSPASTSTTKRKKEPEPKPDREDEATSDYLQAGNIPPAPVADEEEEGIRELAEWMVDQELAEWMVDQELALILEWQAKFGITPAPDVLDPYELDPERVDDLLDVTVLRPEVYSEKESKRRLARDGRVRYYL